MAKINITTWEDFDHEAREIKRITKRQAPETVQLLQDAVGLFANAFSIASPIKSGLNTRDAWRVKMSLLGQNLNTLKCATDLTLRGYYSQSMNLLRIVYENWVAYGYLSKYPARAYLWLHDNDSRRERDLRRHTTMLKDLEGFDESQKDKMRECYKALCSFAHTGAMGTCPLLSYDPIQDEVIVNLGATYEDGSFKRSACWISFLASNMMSLINSYLPKTSRWHNGKEDIDCRIITYIAETQKEKKIWKK